MNLHIWAMATLALMVSAPVHAAPLPTGLAPCGSFTVAHAMGGARLEGTDGTRLRLLALKAPELWSPHSPYKSWPYADESREQLEKLAAGHTLTLACAGPRKDRFGNILAHARLEDGRWLEEALVAEGAALVFPRAGRQEGVAELFAAEDTARAAGLGLWSTEAYRPVAALPDKLKPGWFQIVRGKVVRASRVGDTVFLNFGEDWRRDVTAEIPVRALKSFKKAGLDPLGLTGSVIEVRGWVDYKNGPRLVIPAAGRIRILKKAG